MAIEPDLTAEVFRILRNRFFDNQGNPLSFPLRDKKNTQDDPFDEYICEILKRELPNEATCIKSPGPLTTPDLIVLRPSLCRQSTRAVLKKDLSCIVAIEVKKLERTKTGTIARPSGMDYNTTPPCGTIRIYDIVDLPLDIRCYYLFVCQEPDSSKIGHYMISALVLCDGNALNQDFEYYLSIVGERTKKIDLGTYKDGADRSRPMLIFANPLGAKELDRQITLVHSREDIHIDHEELTRTNILRRSVTKDRYIEFYCYRLSQDVPKGWEESILIDPFPTPQREEKTQPRGKFRLDFKPLE